jgi:hypothetical protein
MQASPDAYRKTVWRNIYGSNMFCFDLRKGPFDFGVGSGPVQFCFPANRSRG